MTNKEEEEPPEIALARKKLHFEGLEPHNRSVDLILQAIQRNDAKIEFAARPRTSCAHLALRWMVSGGVAEGAFAPSVGRNSRSA